MYQDIGTIPIKYEFTFPELWKFKYQVNNPKLEFFVESKEYLVKDHNKNRIIYSHAWKNNEFATVT